MSVQSAAFVSPSNEDTAGLGTAPIPAAPYYRPEYAELEREAIFRRTWLQIAHVCELPRAGSFIVRPIEAANASILITRGKDEKLRAFHNVCTHRGTELVAEVSGTRSEAGLGQLPGKLSFALHPSALRSPRMRV